jgi:hypothetical protein
VLDLLDVVVTKVFADAAAVGKRARLRTIRDRDAAALKLRQAGGVLMDDTVADAPVRKRLSPPCLARHSRRPSIRLICLLRPTGDLYFTELRAQHRKLRFVPAFLRSLSFGAPTVQTVLDAVRYFRASDGKNPSASAPLEFAPTGWKRQIRARAGSFRSTKHTIRRLPSWPVDRSSLGSGPTCRLPYPWLLKRCACRGRVPRRTGRRRPKIRPLNCWKLLG